MRRPRVSRATGSTAAADGRRPYRSRVRQEAAAGTRRRITAAAGDLFAAHGFAGTTVAGIAERAGVAVPTVYAAFGSKGAIVAALLEQVERDADGEGWSRRIAAQDDPYARLALFAGWTTALLSCSRLALRAAQEASGDPAILALRDEGDRRRREGLAALVAPLARAGALAEGLSEQRAVDRAWLVTGVEPYLAATQACGWGDEEYERWLANLLQGQLLGPWRSACDDA